MMVGYRVERGVGAAERAFEGEGGCKNLVRGLSLVNSAKLFQQVAGVACSDKGDLASYTGIFVGDDLHAVGLLLDGCGFQAGKEVDTRVEVLAKCVDKVGVVQTCFGRVEVEDAKGVLSEVDGDVVKWCGGFIYGSAEAEPDQGEDGFGLDLFGLEAIGEWVEAVEERDGNPLAGKTLRASDPGYARAYYTYIDLFIRHGITVLSIAR